MSLKYVLGIVLAISLTTTPLVAQNSKSLPAKNIEKIVGTWKIQKILSGKTEVAKNPTSGQWIQFRSDGKYVNKAAAIDSGSYRMNEMHSILYLESQVNGPTDKRDAKKTVEWSVSFKDDTMTMQQHGVDQKSHADIMKYVYMRIADGSTARKN